MKLENRQNIICIDLDGVILTYRRGMCESGQFGTPVWESRSNLRRLYADGWWVIIYTCRSDRDKIAQVLFDFGIYKGVHYSSINRRKNVIPGTYKGKIGADVYIDDRNIEFKGDWNKTYKRTKNFKPWDGYTKLK